MLLNKAFKVGSFGSLELAKSSVLLASNTEIPPVKSDVVINIHFYRKETFLYLCDMCIEVGIFKVFMEEFSEDFQLKELTYRWLDDT